MGPMRKLLFGHDDHTTQADEEFIFDMKEEDDENCEIMRNIN